MSVDFRSFADFASELLATDTEIAWRMSAARSYYASFHRSQKSVCYCPDNANSRMGSHERVSERFLAQGSNGAKSIAYVLQTMKKIRHVADYELNDPFEKCSAVNQVAQHKALVQRLDSFDVMVAAKSA